MNLGAGDIAAMGAYLQSGGRMYLTGEHSGFDASRNNSLVSFLGAVGGGTVTLQNSAVAGAQAITAAGQAVGLHNSPNAFGSVNFNAAQTVLAANTGNGFQVTQLGSLVGWDFGDIVGASNARILVGFDIEIFQNGQAWTQNMATYLGAGPQQPSVPDGGTSIALLGLALLAMVGLKRRVLSQ